MISDSRMCYILQDGWTALHKAAHQGHLEIAKLLVNKGCDVNVVNDVSYI